MKTPAIDLVSLFSRQLHAVQKKSDSRGGGASLSPFLLMCVPLSQSQSLLLSFLFLFLFLLPGATKTLHLKPLNVKIRYFVVPFISSRWFYVNINQR
jgi:hypothetical protein